MTLRCITWKVLTASVSDHKSSAHFYRSPSVQDEYNRHKENVLKTYETYGEYIKAFILKRRQVVLHPNKFPYHLRKGIEHYILWSIHPMSYTSIENELSKHFNKTNTTHMIWYVNDDKLKSVPDVWHCHVFVKRRSNTRKN